MALVLACDSAAPSASVSGGPLPLDGGGGAGQLAAPEAGGGSGIAAPSRDGSQPTGSLDLPPIVAADPGLDAAVPADAAGDGGVLATPEPPLDTGVPPGVLQRFPRAGATGVCTDLVLTLSFAGDVTLGAAGRVRIFDAAQPETAADAIDMSATAFTDTVAGRAVNAVRPVFLDGRQAKLHFKSGIVQPNRRYFVTVDPGVFRDGAGAPLAGISDASWSFATGEATVSGQLVVDAAGAGDYCSVQGALDAVPANNTSAVSIDVRPGVYHEILYLSRKSNITLRGEDRDATRIEYPNNERLNPGTASRAMFTALNSNGLVLEQLTLHNTTPQGGGQAEAIRVSGDRVILRDATFLSLQDTLLLDGLVYVADAYIEGNVDFVWGYGTAYFERSEIKIVGRSGVIVQARNGADTAGYVFVDSRLTSDPNITGSTLARIDATEYPDSQVAFVDCQMGPHISPQGWTVTPAGTTATAGLRFWEYRSTDLSGQALDVGRRDPASRQLSAGEAAALRNKPGVLGGWDPTL